jgi:hypothetical protein
VQRHEAQEEGTLIMAKFTPNASQKERVFYCAKCKKKHGKVCPSKMIKGKNGRGR